MRILFLILVVANLAFFVIQQGYLGTILPDEREPQRVMSQIKPELMLLKGQQNITAASSTAGSTTTTTTSETSTTAPAATVCVEYGSFSVEESKVVTPLITDRLSTAQISPRTVEEISGYMVYLPPYKTREEALKATDELKQNGISDYFIMDDSSALKFGISLGFLKTEDMAKTQLATLAKKGVKNAQIKARTNNKVWLQVHDTTADLRTLLNDKLADLKTRYPAQELKDCQSP